MKITSKGQVTIPIEIREKLGLLPDTEVIFRVEGNSVKILKARNKTAHGRGSKAVNLLRGSADGKMSTDQILAHTRDR